MESNQFVSSNELLKLRDYTRTRLSEMFTYVRKRAILSPDYIILVVDKASAQLLNSLGSRQFDLITNKIYQVEDLNLGRKRYPMSDVLYLIEPAKRSVQKIIDDFPEQDKLDYD
jgi:hypothetical protein